MVLPELLRTCQLTDGTRVAVRYSVEADAMEMEREMEMEELLPGNVKKAEGCK